MAKLSAYGRTELAGTRIVRIHDAEFDITTDYRYRAMSDGTLLVQHRRPDDPMGAYFRKWSAPKTHSKHRTAEIAAARRDQLAQWWVDSRGAREVSA